MKITTLTSEQTWQSPDGQRTIYTITFNNEAGTPVTRKTYSNIIRQVGWTGEAMEYTKGTDVYVKQPPKEGFGPVAPSAPQSPQSVLPVAQIEALIIRLEAATTKLENYFRDKPTDAEVMRSRKSLPPTR